MPQSLGLLQPQETSRIHINPERVASMCDENDHRWTNDHERNDSMERMVYSFVQFASGRRNRVAVGNVFVVFPRLKQPWALGRNRVALTKLSGLIPRVEATLGFGT